MVGSALRGRIWLYMGTKSWRHQLHGHPGDRRLCGALSAVSAGPSSTAGERLLCGVAQSDARLSAGPPFTEYLRFRARPLRLYKSAERVAADHRIFWQGRKLAIF